MNLRLSGIIQESFVDGPGIRCTIFAQGCNRHCPGCQNPQTQDYNGGKLFSVEEILNTISKDPLLDGVSFSGGECFDQPEGFAELADRIKEKYKFKICAWSGYLYEELIISPKKKKLLEKIDYLVDGPFILSKKTLNLKWRGSSNQRLIDVKESLKYNKIIEIEDFKI